MCFVSAVVCDTKDINYSNKVCLTKEVKDIKKITHYVNAVVSFHDPCKRRGALHVNVVVLGAGFRRE